MRKKKGRKTTTKAQSLSLSLSLSLSFSLSRVPECSYYYDGLKSGESGQLIAWPKIPRLFHSDGDYGILWYLSLPESFCVIRILRKKTLGHHLSARCEIFSTLAAFLTKASPC